MAGLALAAGLYVERWGGEKPAAAVSPAAVSTEPPSTGTPGQVAVPGSSRTAAADGVSDSQIGPTEPAAKAAPFGVAATLSIHPMVKQARWYLNKNMNVYPPFTEPTFSLMSTELIFASLCDGNSIQVVVADRRILAEELAACRVNKKRIAEVKFGYEGAVAVVNSNLYPQPRLTARAIFLGLAREVPDPLHPEAMIQNPYVTWDQVDSTLPSERIDVLGAPASSADGMAFRDTVLKAGCSSLSTIAALKALDPQRFETVCGATRADGYYRTNEITQSANASTFDVVGYLQANPGALAIRAYGESALRTLNLSAASIDGVTPSLATIYSGTYPGARTLYLYVNTMMPAARNFAFALWSSWFYMSLPGSVSVDAILTPLDATEQRSLRDQARDLPELPL